MKAIVQDAYGTADVLRLDHVPEPEVGEREVLVGVRAAGVDPGVWHVMTGLPYLVRFAGYGLRTPKVRIRGTDVAGRVLAVGQRVKRFRIGDDVFGTCEGAFAEKAVAREGTLAAMPANVTFWQAAAVPTSGVAALQGLRKTGVRPGQRVLIIGAAGGVGTFAVQIAKASGTEVCGVCTTAKVETVRSIGADHVIDYTREDFVANGGRYDVILDTVGNRPLSELRRALTARGTLVVIGGDGGRWLGGMVRQIRALAWSPWVQQSLRPLLSSVATEDLLCLKQLIEESKVTPFIDRLYPLADAPEAIRYVTGPDSRGKTVIAVDCETGHP